MTREEARAIYTAHMEEEPDATVSVKQCYSNYVSALDAYIYEICVDMFHFAYELGFEAGKAGAHE